MKDQLIKDREQYLNDAKECVEDAGIEWEDVFMEYDYSPPFEDYSDHIAFEFYKGGFIALDNLLIKISN